MLAPVTPRSQQLPTLAELALAQRAQLRRAVTFSEWKSAHPGDRFMVYARDSLREGPADWCAAAITDVPVESGGTARRVAYFAVPEPDAALTLPQADSALIGKCRLGHVSFEIADPSESRAAAIAAATRLAIGNAVGAETSAHPWRPGATAWRSAAYWLRDSIEIISGIAGTSSVAPGARPPSRVFVRLTSSVLSANFESSKYGIVPGGGDGEGPDAIATRIEETIRLAAAGDDAERAALALLSHLGPGMFGDRFATPDEADSVSALLATWVSHAAGLPPQRRAAALVAADLLLDAIGERIQLGDPVRASLRTRFSVMGATFNYGKLGDWYTYTRSWLKEARTLDPDGRAGEITFLTLMERGFETSGQCTDQGEWGFEAVIAQGEAWLRAHPRSAFAPAVHRMLGGAYADAVAVATGLAYQSGRDVAELRPRVGANRERAIAEFRAALTVDHTSPAARRAWDTAWRLLAGVGLTSTRFYCIND